MYKCIYVNGGIGRMICSIPALEKFIKKNPDGYVITEGGIEFVLGNKLLQDRTFDVNTKGLFENIIKNGEIITTEPYRDWEYYNQKISIAQAFDKQINGSYDPPETYIPKLTLNKEEEITGVAVIKAAKEKHGKEKTILIQPFGRGANNDTNLGLVYDHGSRSLELRTYFAIAKALSEKYNIITMSEFDVPGDEIALRPKDLTLRKWAGVIEQCNYFVGCDSVGQHIARSYNIPGSVILGATFAVNVSYPSYFNIIEKVGFDKRYDPIRVCEFGCFESNRLNDTVMDFSDEETEQLVKNIMSDIKSKIGE